MQNKDVLTTHDVARILSVDMSTVIDWIDRKKIVGYKTLGGHRRVRRGDLLSFLKEHNMPAFETLGGGSPMVLLVEDDADLRRAMMDMVRSRRPDAALHEAADGFLAGKMISTLKPDVVVLDLFLPGVDGFKVCEHIRADASLFRTRIVAVSGHDTPENRRRILRAGADVFLPKPLGLARLGEVVDRILSTGPQPAAR